MKRQIFISNEKLPERDVLSDGDKMTVKDINILRKILVINAVKITEDTTWGDLLMKEE